MKKNKGKRKESVSVLSNSQMQAFLYLGLSLVTRFFQSNGRKWISAASEPCYFYCFSLNVLDIA
jgi:hypothetical protein